MSIEQDKTHFLVQKLRFITRLDIILLD